MAQRMIETNFIEEDAKIEGTLRPQLLKDYVGQEKIKENLKVYIEAAKQRKDALDHVLFYGPPGLGKTTLAGVIANEMGVHMKVTSGPAIEKPGDMAAILNNLQEGDLLFVDEIHRLNRQVEEVTDGAISAKAMGTALSAGVSISVGLAMVRVLTGVSILWFLVPGYVFAIGISFVVPKLFTAIAFDAGGVASGPMTATFLLPLAQGACVAVGGNIVTDAFGVVAMVAMTPLITVQLMGLVAQLRTRKARRLQPAAIGAAFAGLPDDDIIEL